MTRPNASHPAEDARLTRREKLAWGIGGLPEAFFVLAVQQLIYPIYNIMLGLNPTLIGIVLAVRTMWDAFTDPWVGHLSDKRRGRVGRKPFMIVGIVVAAVTYVAIWWIPPGLSGGGLFTYLLVTVLVYTTASTFYFVPYLALGYGLSVQLGDRTALQAYRMTFMKIGTFTIPWMFYLTQLSWWSSPAMGVRVLSVIAAGIFLIAGLASALLVRERPYVAPTTPPVPFWQGMRQMAGNATLRHYLLMVLLLGQSVQLVNSLGLYVIIFHMYDGDREAAASLYAMGSTVYFGLSIASIPLITYVANRIGKVRALQICCLIVGVVSALKWVFFSDSNPYLIFIIYVLLAPGLSGFNLIRAAMIADLVDDDEHRNGVRREGVLAAVDQWSYKATAALALLGTGLILQFSGFDASLPQQDAEVISNLRLSFSIIPAAGALASFWLALTYPLTEARAADLRAALPSLAAAPVP
jgi:glycoside/pentoside/hexuronide:cation symporter, GPH family